MMTSLFSSFDPCSSYFLPNWLSNFIFLILVPSSFWLTSNRIIEMSKKIIFILYLEFKMLLGNFSKNSTLMFMSLILLIIINNFMGLHPYVFTSTSHLVTALTFAAPLWGAFMLYGWINNMSSMFTHLVPLSTPKLLMPFMVVIETISNLIRPLTLSVRLAANMIAGHLLLTLLGNQTSLSSFKFLPILLMTQVVLLILEAAVALIQAYVFTVLSTLYSSEVVIN